LHFVFLLLFAHVAVAVVVLVVLVVVAVQIADTRIIMQFAICHGTTFRPIRIFDVTRQKDCDVVAFAVVAVVVWPLVVCLSVCLTPPLEPFSLAHTDTIRYKFTVVTAEKYWRLKPKKNNKSFLD